MRKLYQTLIILYKKEQNEILYAIFYRTSHPIWQFILGGGEGGKSIFETVIREIGEETSININKEDIIELDSKSSIPVVNITGDYTWGKDVYVVPEYTFAVNVKDLDIKLSDEHKEFKWVRYEEAMEKLNYDSNKTALWELNERLKRKNNTLKFTSY